MTVTLDGNSLTIEEVVAVARDDRSVEIGDDARTRVRESRERVEDILKAGDPVYGVNTGFGELVDTQVPESRVADLQTNLVRSHAAGTGRELSREEVRAMIVTRINALLKGYSGIRLAVVELLADLLNERVTPVVPSRGSLGASGDLAPLAHLALVLIGEGDADVVRDRSDDAANETSERLSGEEALAAVGLEPVELRAKEGLALINGTQLTLGIGALLVVDAERLCRGADVAGALTTEVTMGTTAACAEPVHDLRPHRGQSESARAVRRLTAESDVVESHRNCDRVQDAYSIRCLPQIHGAVRDAVSHLREAVSVELNSVTDNPLVFPRADLDDRASGTDRAAVVSGGNFHGAPLAHRLDYLVAVLTDLAAVSERRIDRIVNPNLQEPHLPPFLAGDPGVESGLMIAQYTAASLVTECRSIGRAATDNIPVSGGQEDHVSMSATAAMNAQRVLERARQVVATELLCGAEAAEYVDEKLGNGTSDAYETVREVARPLSGDRRPDRDVAAVETLIETGLLAAAIDEGKRERDRQRDR
ncbi:histidine ammonia-lyase [Natronorubrum sp. JWXQ-INN-674]|uniref:Histidine ammonia-lyase n=1 Tax=Natronorubrum halalkaliphilum TaxID=2691917 RepID=A0A6B0VSR4_9EURY|nr:histidine ammonia-lyase [Natronorubrum halalkaliphilum]MXV63549.1 histidine ammonia-lyase [Natronorubrum halalkaliphilum]